MFFKFRKKTKKKEFMKYENGKIIPVDVDQPANPYHLLEENEIPIYQELEQPLKERKMPLSLSPKLIKPIISITVLVLFVFTLVDIYNAFFIENEEDQFTLQDETNKDHLINDSLQSKHLSNFSHKLNYNPKEEIKDNLSENETDTKNHPLKDTLDTIHFVNDVLVKESLNEMRIIQDYLELKRNRKALENGINKSIKEKQYVYMTLVIEKSLLRNSNLKELFDKTENRILASIQFSERSLSLLDSGSKHDFNNHIDLYIEQDFKLMRSQVDSFIKVLEEFDIEYNRNELNQVEYSL